MFFFCNLLDLRSRKTFREGDGFVQQPVPESGGDGAGAVPRRFGLEDAHPRPVRLAAHRRAHPRQHSGPRLGQRRPRLRPTGKSIERIPNLNSQPYDWKVVQHVMERNTKAIRVTVWRRRTLSSRSGLGFVFFSRILDFPRRFGVSSRRCRRATGRASRTRPTAIPVALATASSRPPPKSCRAGCLS